MLHTHNHTQPHTTTSSHSTAALPVASSALHHHHGAFAFGVTVALKEMNAHTAARIHDLGVQHVRLQIHKSVVQRTQGGDPDWSASDAAVDALHAYPLAIILTLEGFPAWDEDACKLPTPAAVTEWGTQVITRYGEKIRGVEMLNEEPSFAAADCRAPQRYFDIISVAYPALHALNPALSIGGFGYTHYTGLAGTDGDPAFYFAELVRLGAAQYVDYFAAHLYNNGLPMTQAKATGYPTLMEVVNAVKDAQRTLAHPKPFRLTEFGWETLMQTHGKCSHPIAPELQSQYTLQAYDLLRADAFVTGGYLYTCFDSASVHTVDCHNVDQQPVYSALQRYIKAHA